MIKTLVALFALLVGGCGNNTAPQFVTIGPQTAAVGAKLELELDAYDQEGDALSFHVSCQTIPSLGERAMISFRSKDVIFSWTPDGSDVGIHRLDFAVTDGEFITIESAVFTVRSSNKAESAPIFRKPLSSGISLVLQNSRCLELDIIIEDPDTVEIEIRQETPIEGDTLKSSGPQSASYRWCPTVEQSNQQRFVLRFSANDHDNPPVYKDFTVVILVSLPEQCPGEAPHIAHTPSPEINTPDPIYLEAMIQDETALKSDPIIYFTTTAPAGVPNFEEMKQTTMLARLADPNIFYTYLQNPMTELSPGESMLLYYVIMAEDNDDLMGPCDHRTLSPEQGFHTITIDNSHGSTSCSKTGECSSEQVCADTFCIKDDCLPEDSDGDLLFNDQGTCPTNHFCPLSGLESASHCVEECNVDQDCLIPGTTCKVFERERGCGTAGEGEVGDACEDFTHCGANAMCLPWSGGYCTLSDCDSLFAQFSGPCPAGSLCVGIPDDRMSPPYHWICLKECGSDNDCRGSAGYSCQDILTDAGTNGKSCLPKAP